MYNYQFHLKDIYNPRPIYSGTSSFFVCKKVNNKYYFTEVTAENQEVITRINNVYDFTQIDDEHIILKEDQRNLSLIFNTKSRLIEREIVGVKANKVLDENRITGYYRGKDGDYYVVLNHYTNDLELSIPVSKGSYLFYNDNLIGVERSSVFLRNRNGIDVWTLDTREIGYFVDEIFGRRPGKVAAVEVWNDKLIVLTGKKVLWLEMETGQLLWELETGQLNSWIILEDDIAYVNYLRINLQTRQIEESLYMKGGILYKDTPTEKYTIRVEYFVKPTLHDDKLWAIANNSYGRYAVAIDKLTGEYVWYYLLDTDGNLSAPKFHSNKMYVWDDTQKLHVFEDKDE